MAAAMNPAATAPSHRSPARSGMSLFKAAVMGESLLFFFFTGDSGSGSLDVQQPQRMCGPPKAATVVTPPRRQPNAGGEKDRLATGGITAAEHDLGISVHIDRLPKVALAETG